MKKLLLLAGEESGLIYASRIAEKLKAAPGGCEIRGYAYYGFRTADLAVMGFWAVMKKAFFFMRVRRTMKNAIRDWKPDAVCTVDYPGMNLPLAAYAKSLGIRTVHVVSPQVWAWKKGRIPKIEASLDTLLCFFPFEPDLFRSGFAEYVGHPLVEEMGASRGDAARERNLVAILPGSRIGEIENILPVMIKVSSFFPSVRFAIPAANTTAKDAILRILSASGADASRFETSIGDARAVLHRARCAVVASGTATLESVLSGCPTLLVYRVGPLLAMFARLVIKEIKHVGLVNVLWEKCGGGGEAPMPELLQEKFTPENVAGIVRPWIEDDAAFASAVKKLSAAVALFGEPRPGGAVAAIVKEIFPR